MSGHAHDLVHGAIAAGLVAGGLAFTTTVNRSPSGADVRLFNIPFVIDDRTRYSVTLYVGGVVVIGVTALVLSDPSRRLAVSDFVADKNALARVARRAVAGMDERVVWFEAAVPLPSSPELLVPELATAPVRAVSTSVGLALEQFAECLSPLKTETEVPLMETTPR